MLTAPPAAIEIVKFLASHAVPLFLVLLLCLLVSASAGWVLFRRYGLHHEQSRWPPLAYLLGHLALGFALIVGAAALFAGIAEAIGDGEAIGQLDLLFSETVRATIDPTALQLFARITHVGDPLLLGSLALAACAVLLRLRRYWLCAALVLTGGGAALLNLSLKALFQRTRPVHTHGLTSAEGWSFPSGHASGAVVIYGMLAYLLLRLLPARTAEAPRLLIALLAAVLAFTSGGSRVLLQVHFATDVLAGFASGLAWLMVCVLTMELARYRYGGRR
jgi:membrane-associated phospholipid phosphatase